MICEKVDMGVDNGGDGQVWHPQCAGKNPQAGSVAYLKINGPEKWPGGGHFAPLTTHSRA